MSAKLSGIRMLYKQIEKTIDDSQWHKQQEEHNREHENLRHLPCSHRGASLSLFAGCRVCTGEAREDRVLRPVRSAPRQHIPARQHIDKVEGRSEYPNRTLGLPKPKKRGNLPFFERSQ